MNPAEFCLRHRTTSLVLTIILLACGVVSYIGMSRLEDPEFTIKDVLVYTTYPGASAEEVEEEVTDELETAIQQLGQLDELESKSQRGLSIITVSIKDKYDGGKLPQVWDELRRKVADAQSNLPPGADTSIVYDDYGDVYGVYLILHGDEYSYAELRRVADYLKRELLLVDDVAKIVMHGQRTEAIFVEPVREKLAQLGTSQDAILGQLRERNLVRDTGRVKVGSEFIAIDPTGEINSVEDVAELVFSHGERQFHLRDIAKVRRGYVEPQGEVVRYDGKNGIALGISTVEGGNVVRMGEALDKRLAELEGEIPLGMELSVISHQSAAVTKAIDGFVSSLVQALVIVIVMLLVFMGLRAGVLIGLVLLLTIMGSFVFLNPMGVALERVSLGALIIALGMLVDNAIVVVDGILVGLKRGKSATESAVAIVRQSALPLLGATAIAVFAFAAIGTSDNNAGEFCRSLFSVICVSLLLSWVTAVTVTPLLGVMMLRKPKEPTERKGRKGPGPAPFDNRFYRIYKNFLRGCIRFRWLTVLLVAGMFAAAIWAFGYVKQSFFPPSTRAQFMVDYWMPQGTHIDETTAGVERLENWLLEQDGITHVTSVVGRGALRFLLTYRPEKTNSAYAQLIVDVEDSKRIPELIGRTDAYLGEEHQDALGYGVKFELGPGGKGKIQPRFFGPDPEVLRELAEQAMEVMRDEPNAKAIRTDWRQKVKVLRPQLADDRANLLGIGKGELSLAIRQEFQGRTVGVFREGDLLLPVIMRASAPDRAAVDQVENIQVWSPVAKQRVPFNQVVSGMETEFEDEIRMRFDRKPMITVFCDPVEGTASALLEKLRPKIEAIPLPAGYSLEWFGETRDQQQANSALAAGIPVFALLMLLTTVMLFNSLRQPLVIWLCVPLSIIGVSAGLLLTDQPFSFMALLGFISLSGMLLKNAIVLVDELNAQLGAGKDAYDAVVDSAASRLLPVAMAASTTAFGMVPLFFDDFFASMAVTIVFGLMFATVLTMVGLPVFYTILYRIRPSAG
ncbi:MAG: efflux RND transporter permease subunit [Verrucomicrobiota bacterium JB025]|nr:efflux RND transporter permease subunit [Verrucomicrobiota bacterium JB025]